MAGVVAVAAAGDKLAIGTPAVVPALDVDTELDSPVAGKEDPGVAVAIEEEAEAALIELVDPWLKVPMLLRLEDTVAVLLPEKVTV